MHFLLSPFFRRLAGAATTFACLLQCPAAPPDPIEGSHSLVVIPDSQVYVWKRPELYTLQTGWVAANVAKYNIVRLLHVGDITQHNLRTQWEAARRAHRIYEGLLPAIYAPGNHDFGENGKATSRDTLFNEFIPIAAYQAQEGFIGVYDKEPQNTQNSAHRFSVGGRKWLALALEFAPRDDVVRWADAIVAAHADHSVVVLTHAYLRPEALRYDRKRAAAEKKPNHTLDAYPLSRLPGGFNDGEDLWNKLIAKHANMALVVCGHVCTSAHLADKGVHGNTVHQILVDYQNAPQGGTGWLRLLQFLPDGRTVRVRDYSPLLDETSQDPSCSFDFVLDPPPGPVKAVVPQKEVSTGEEALRPGAAGWSCELVRRIPAPEAKQGVAAGTDHLYAINNHEIGKYRKGDGVRIATWSCPEGTPLTHLNAGIVHAGRLYCAHSNFPGVPHRSSVEIWDEATLRHAGSHDFGRTDGSLTWIDRRGDSWIACFVHYGRKGGEPGRGPEWTRVVSFDQEWKETGSWTFPPALIAHIGAKGYSCSGGAIGPGGLLFVTGHDEPELYVLEFPATGSALVWKASIPIPAQGQAFGWDPSRPGILYLIGRKSREIVEVRIRPPG